MESGGEVRKMPILGGKANILCSINMFKKKHFVVSIGYNSLLYVSCMQYMSTIDNA